MDADADIRVLRGSPTDEELAAVVVALSSIRDQAAGEPAHGDERSSPPPTRVKRPLYRPPNAWQATWRMRDR